MCDSPRVKEIALESIVPKKTSSFQPEIIRQSKQKYTKDTEKSFKPKLRQDLDVRTIQERIVNYCDERFLGKGKQHGRSNDYFQ
jgi:hypothetical protein